MAASSTKHAESQLPIVIFSLALGLGGIGLFLYGVFRPVPMRNLADPIPAVRKPRFTASAHASEPSIRRQLANKKNEEWTTHCTWRFEDCEMACRQYAAGSPDSQACLGYCADSRASCMEWSHN